MRRIRSVSAVKNERRRPGAAAFSFPPPGNRWQPLRRQFFASDFAVARFEASGTFPPNVPRSAKLPGPGVALMGVVRPTLTETIGEGASSREKNELLLGVPATPVPEASVIAEVEFTVPASASVTANVLRAPVVARICPGHLARGTVTEDPDGVAHSGTCRCRRRRARRYPTRSGRCC